VHCCCVPTVNVCAVKMGCSPLVNEPYTCWCSTWKVRIYKKCFAYYNAALPRFSYVTDPSSDRITMFSEHPEQCIQRIGEYVDIGVDRFMLSFPESASDISGLRLVGEKVLPSFKYCLLDFKIEKERTKLAGSREQCSYIVRQPYLDIIQFYIWQTRKEALRNAFKNGMFNCKTC
jgi:hypothetical protein